jgi:hypothetical protein
MFFELLTRDATDHFTRVDHVIAHFTSPHAQGLSNEAANHEYKLHFLMPMWQYYVKVGIIANSYIERKDTLYYSSIDF